MVVFWFWSVFMPTYGDRNSLLVTLGFLTYQDYLSSDLWLSILKRCFRLKGTVCTLCKRKKASVVHHVAYSKKVLLGLDMKPLFPLCQGCHVKIEFSAKGDKRTLNEAQALWYKLVSNKEGKSWQTEKGNKRKKEKRKKGKGWRCKSCRGGAKKGYSYCRPCARKEGGNVPADLWGLSREVRETQRRERRKRMLRPNQIASRKEVEAAILEVQKVLFDIGLTLRSANGGIHWIVVKNKVKILEFWPTTGKWHDHVNGRWGDAMSWKEIFEIASRLVLEPACLVACPFLGPLGI